MYLGKKEARSRYLEFSSVHMFYEQLQVARKNKKEADSRRERSVELFEVPSRLALERIEISDEPEEKKEDESMEVRKILLF